MKRLISVVEFFTEATASVASMEVTPLHWHSFWNIHVFKLEIYSSLIIYFIKKISLQCRIYL
jgi:uncharacterized membrane protein